MPTDQTDINGMYYKEAKSPDVVNMPNLNNITMSLMPTVNCHFSTTSQFIMYTLVENKTVKYLI